MLKRPKGLRGLSLNGDIEFGLQVYKLFHPYQWIRLLLEGLGKGALLPSFMCCGCFEHASVS